MLAAQVLGIELPNSIVGWACFFLGIVVMYITMMFITRFLENSANATPPNLAKFFGIILGGTVVAFLGSHLSAGKNEFGYYAVGLFVGLVVYGIFYWIRNGNPPTILPERFYLGN